MASDLALNPEKFRDVVLYTLSKCPPDRIGAVKLHKVLYYSDMMAYAQTRKPMTNAVYRKRPFGPTADYLLAALRQMEIDGLISVCREDYFGYLKTVYHMTHPFSGTNKLSSSELAIVDEVIDFVCYNNSAKTISDLSHTRAWELAEVGKEIPYHSVFQMFPEEVSLEAVDWGSDEASLVEIERSTTDPLDYESFASFRERLKARQDRRPDH